MSEQTGQGETTQLTRQVVQPPRLAGSVEQQMAALQRWLWDVFTKLALTDLFVRFSEQFGSVDFDPGSLPDPASATIASAQETANNAYILAASALNNFGPTGQFTITDPDTTAVVTFDDEEANDDYVVQITPDSFSGTASSNGFIVVSVVKTTAGFTVTIAAAPGTSAAITFNYTVFR